MKYCLPIHYYLNDTIAVYLFLTILNLFLLKHLKLVELRTMAIANQNFSFGFGFEAIAKKQKKLRLAGALA